MLQPKHGLSMSKKSGISRAFLLIGVKCKSLCQHEEAGLGAIPAASKHFAQELMEEVNADRKARGKKPFDEDPSPET